MPKTLLILNHIFLILLLFSPIKGQENRYFPLSVLPSDSLFSDLNQRYNHSLKISNESVKSLKYSNEVIKIFTDRKNKVLSDIENKHYVFDYRFNTYINKLLEDIIAVNHVDLGNMDIKLLISRHPWPNAYCLGDGTLVVNIGLISHIQNADQLAFVICHELAHYYLDHVNNDIFKHLEHQNSKEFKKELKSIQKEKYNRKQQLEDFLKDLIYDDRKHSRSHEKEADALGFVFFSKTSYSESEALTALSLLDSIDREKYDLPLQLEEVFGFEKYPFKEKWLKKGGDLFGGERIDATLSKEEKEALKTHPDAQKRILLLKSSINKSEQKITPLDELPLICDYEKIIFEHDFLLLESCLFHTLQLLKKYPNDTFLQLYLLKCMSLIYQHRLLHIYTPDNQLNSTEFEKITLFLENIRLSELSKINFHLSLKGLENNLLSKNEEYLYLTIKAAFYTKEKATFEKYKEFYQKEFNKGTFLHEIDQLIFKE